MRQEPNRAGEMAAFVRVVQLGGFAQAGRALGLIRRLTLAGAGVARLAEFTIRRDVEEGRLVRVLPNAIPDFDEVIHAVYVGRSERLPGRVTALLDHLARHGRVTDVEDV